MPGLNEVNITPEQKEILNNLLNDNPTVKTILKEKGLCTGDACNAETIMGNIENFNDTAQIWTQINNNLKISNSGNEENAFITKIRERYDKVMDDIQGIPSVTQSVDSNYDDKTKTEKIFREMSSERIRLNNSEKIRLMVWGVATVGIFLITFNKLRK
tara:strand:- start:5232 stop:5705 length:474 start_codon:yes stop_codon:yes gene_type:complete